MTWRRCRPLFFPPYLQIISDSNEVLLCLTIFASYPKKSWWVVDKHDGSFFITY